MRYLVWLCLLLSGCEFNPTLRINQPDNSDDVAAVPPIHHYIVIDGVTLLDK